MNGEVRIENNLELGCEKNFLKKSPKVLVFKKKSLSLHPLLERKSV
jgi:hypothetical protein